MTEKNYSANFKLYSRDGLNAQFTVRADEMSEHVHNLTVYLESLLADGWSVREPAHLEGVYKTDQIIGYIWGRFKDSKNNDAPTICCHLYNARGKFKSYTVYPEQLNTLPAEVLSTKPKTIKDTVLMAPATVDARDDRAWHDWNTTINIKPKLNADGSLWKNENGYPQYYYDGVVGAQAKQTEPETTPTTPDKPSAELLTARKTLHALGQTFYSSIDEDWNEVRKTAIAALNKRYGTNYTSSNDLPLESVEKWIVQLEKKTRTQIMELAELVFADDVDQAIADLVSEQMDGQTSSLDLLGGVALTRVLKAVEKALENMDN